MDEVPSLHQAFIPIKPSNLPIGPNQGLRHGHGQPPMDPTMVALLDSLRGNGVPYKAGDTMTQSSGSEPEYG